MFQHKINMHTVSISVQQTCWHTHVSCARVLFPPSNAESHLHTLPNKQTQHKHTDTHTQTTFSKCNVAVPHNEIRACDISLFRFIKFSMLHFVSLPLSLSLLLLQIFFWLHLNFATHHSKKKVCMGGSNAHRATIE